MGASFGAGLALCLAGKNIPSAKELAEARRLENQHLGNFETIWERSEDQNIPETDQKLSANLFLAL